MSINNAISAQGSTLGVAAIGAPPYAYTLIKQLSDFTISTGQATRLDASNLDSTEKEYIAGLFDHGAVTLKGQHVHSDPGQTILRNNTGNGTLLHFQASTPDGGSFTWDAECAEFSIAPSTDKVLEFTAIIWPRNYVEVA